MPFFVEHTSRAGQGSILALDMATLCGWAACFEDGRVASGEWAFPAQTNKHPGYRFLKFRYALTSFRKGLMTPKNPEPKIKIAYEEVMFSGKKGKGQTQRSAQLFGAWRGILQGWCATYDFPCEGIHNGTIKKFITGDGGVKKQPVIDAINMIGHDVSSDNQADALALLYLTLEKEKYSNTGGSKKDNNHG